MQADIGLSYVLFLVLAAHLPSSKNAPRFIHSEDARFSLSPDVVNIQTLI
jgi:hypothetical protein